MHTTVFHSADLPQTERLARFDDFLLHSDHPMRLTETDPEPFQATARAFDLGPVNIVELTCSPSLVRRTPATIRQADPELCSIVFPRRGALVVTQAGREALLGERDLALYDSSRPFSVRLAGPGPVTLVRAHVPRALLPLSARRTDRLLGTRLPGQEGVAALLTHFLGDLAADRVPRPTADIERLSTVTLDLLAATLAHHLDTGPRLPDESRRRTLLLSVESFVQEHLCDPGLSPRDIAAAHHISVSYLHRLFRSRDTTVTELIRRRRLERARRALTDPGLRDVPVHRIAADCGFREHAAFTRAFHAAYGMPPRDWRRQALRAPRG
ncbi:helix-turn-helix domain-containing protein [Streptomyces bicolor]|uniref:helix-turn-helix domain-containing protein n=1 Tax=Streptomyces bicolor TaxID=66874 RepID=UPI0004E194F4|nr:helix-turn-helix domain-containing protein [Streptomyces bicolor]